MALVGLLSALKVKDNWTATESIYVQNRQSLTQILGVEFNEDKLSASDLLTRENYKNAFLAGVDFAHYVREMVTAPEVKKEELRELINEIKDDLKEKEQETHKIIIKEVEFQELLGKFKNLYAKLQEQLSEVNYKVLENLLKARAKCIRPENRDEDIRLQNKENLRQKTEDFQNLLETNQLVDEEVKNIHELLEFLNEIKKISTVKRLKLLEEEIVEHDAERKQIVQEICNQAKQSGEEWLEDPGVLSSYGDWYQRAWGNELNEEELEKFKDQIVLKIKDYEIIDEKGAVINYKKYLEEWQNILREAEAKLRKISEENEHNSEEFSGTMPCSWTES